MTPAGFGDPLAPLVAKKKGKGGKVIHVVFGPNGGKARPTGAAPTPETAPSGVEPVTDVFTPAEVARLTGLSSARLRSLDRDGVISPSGELRGKRAYTFRDLIVVRTVQGLLGRKVKIREVSAAVRALRTALPRVTRPLAELRVVSDGTRVVVRSHEGAFEPVSGQMLLDFDVRDLEADVVRVLRPKAREDRVRAAFELYTRASQLDEDAKTLDEAEKLYRRAIELDPSLAIAYTNLGNISFRRGEEASAVKLYKEALAIDDAQPEAQYNLGYVLLEHGDSQGALVYFEGAVRTDGNFADAHFYLAMTYETLGRREKARASWRRYLELEPTGTWAEIAKKHLLDVSWPKQRARRRRARQRPRSPIRVGSPRTCARGRPGRRRPRAHAETRLHR